MRPFFIWKNESSLDKNIIVTKLPDIERATKDIEKIIVPGRNGFIAQDNQTYQSTVKTIECVLDGNTEDIEELCAWLDGSSDLVLSNEEDRGYKATIINKVPFSKIVPLLHEFIIIFDCQPFKYNLYTDKINVTRATTIYNQGTVYSEPIFKIYGTGNVSVTLNGNTFLINDLVDYVTVDSVLQDCYRESTLMNNKMSGDFPVFEVGKNEINWMGNITKIEISPNWRWL